MRFTIPVCLCLGLLLCGNLSWAQQDKTQEEDDAWAKFALEEVLLRRSDDPMLESALAVPQPKLILEGTDDGKTQVKARIGVEISKKQILDLTVTSPRNSSGNTALTTVDGLSNGSAAEVSFSWIFWQPASYTDKMRKQLRQNDKNKNNKTEPKPVQGATTPEATQNDETAEKNDNNKTELDWESRILNYNKQPIERGSAMEILGPDNYRSALIAAREAFASPRWWPVFLTASAKAEQQDFRFVDSATLASGKESHIGRSFTAAVGTFMQGKYYGELSYSRGTEFSGGRTADLCAPFGSTRALECRKVTLGPPTEATSEDLKIEMRRLFGSIGFAARLARDLESNVTSAELPIYFLQKMGASEVELNGGIAIKWNSDTDDFSVSAFIGPALSTVFRMADR